MDDTVEKTEEFGPILSSEKVLGAIDFGERLDIHPSKLRRWSIEVEKHDYQIMRDSSNRRLYLESDIPLFKKLKDFIEVKKVPAEESYKSVSAMFKDYRHRLSTDVNREQNTEKAEGNSEVVVFTKEQFEELMKGFDERTEQAVERALEKSQERFLEIMASRDNKLVTSLRETLEQPKLLAASTTEQETPKKGFFSKIFGK